MSDFANSFCMCMVIGLELEGKGYSIVMLTKSSKTLHMLYCFLSIFKIYRTTPYARIQLLRTLGLKGKARVMGGCEMTKWFGVNEPAAQAGTAHHGWAVPGENCKFGQCQNVIW